MNAKVIQEQGEKTYALIFETGDEVATGLAEFARKNRLAGSHFTAIGAFRDVTLGYFDWEKKDYTKIPIREQVEVLALVGDIALDRGEPKVHAHVVVGKADCWKRASDRRWSWIRQNPKRPSVRIATPGQSNLEMVPMSRNDPAAYKEFKFDSTTLRFFHFIRAKCNALQ